MNLPDFLTRDADGYIHVTGRRIGIEHLVFYYNDGYSAEMLAAEYPTISLAVVHKIIAFYLENQADLDKYIAHCNAESERHRKAASPGPSLAELRRRMAARQPVSGD